MKWSTGPDALSSEKPVRTPGNARGDRRGLGGGTVSVNSRKIPPARAAGPSRPALGNGNHPVFPGARGGKRAGLHVVSGRRRLPACPLGGDRRADPARRISHFLHAVPGGNLPGHADRDLRISDADVPAHRAGSRQRLDVRRFDRPHRSGADGRTAHREASCARGAVGASGIPAGAGHLREESRARGRGDWLHRNPGRSMPRRLLRRSFSDAAAVVVQSPNFFGVLEDVAGACADAAHASGALAGYDASPKPFRSGSFGRRRRRTSWRWKARRSAFRRATAARTWA